jgi:acyl-CoA synthetase (AMP-forming)/AMP-acid ligase II
MIHRSLAHGFAVPEGTLSELVLRRAEDIPGKLALLDAGSGRAFTYGELREAVGRVAANLASLGFKTGDVFAIACPNSAEFVLAFHGVMRLGGTVTTLNPAYTAEEMAHQLKDSGAKWLLASSAIASKAREAAEAAGVHRMFGIGAGEGFTPFEQLEAPTLLSTRLEIDPATHLAALPYSSGTTGLPKGVMLTHRNLAANVMQGAAFGLREEDVVLGVLPLFHIFGMNVVMNTTLAMGATLVLMPRFEVDAFLRAMSHHRVTFAFLVPPILLTLAKHPAVDEHDLSSLRQIISGAAPLGEDLVKEVGARLGCRVRQGYGLTETSPVISASAEDGSTPHGSIGLLVGGTECQIVDPESGAVLGPGQAGELWVRGPQVMQGYLNRPEATAQVLDPEGWFHTGDIAYVDAEGHAFIVDRLKELIKVKGMQVAPAELEGLLLAHPHVADAAVIPVPDDRAGELPKAFVVLRPEASVTADELMAYVEAKVAAHKRIRFLEFVDGIPKSPSGKILRRVLVAAEREARAK